MNYGGIFWDLGIRTEYVAGTELSCHLTIVNTTDISRNYSIIARVIDKDGNVIIEGDILVNDETWFTLAARQSIEIPGFVVIEASDCILELGLYEESLGQVVDNCYTYLYSSELELVTLPSLQITSTTCSLIIIVVLIMFAGIIGTMSKVMVGGKA